MTGITRSFRRSFPFFKRELRVVIADMSSPKPLTEIVKELGQFFRPEIINIFEDQTGQNNKYQTLKNLRGRPVTSTGTEREILLKIEGKGKSLMTDEMVPFAVSVETKFKEFSEGAIYYSPFPVFPEGMEFSDFTGLFQAENIEFSRLEIGLDYFENREFPFLGMKLQELKERFYVSLTAKISESGSKVDGTVENNNLQLSDGFSGRMREKIGFLEQITAIPELSRKINE